MSLTPLNWKQLPTTIIAAGTATAQPVLDAITAAFASATYADGSARVVGSGSAWSASAATESVYLSPPLNTLGQRVCIGGSAVSRILTFATGSGQSWIVNQLYVGIGKNVTTNAANWYNPGPFADGSFSGYICMGVARNASFASTLRCYESQEAIAITVEIAGLVYMACIAGAWLDPESANAADCESDGKLYGVTGIGTTNTVVVPWAYYSNYAFGLFSTYGTGSNNTVAQSVIFTPGAATTIQTLFISQYANATTYEGMRNLATSPVRFPIFIGAGTVVAPPTSTFLGRVREIYTSAYGLNGTAYEAGGSTVGYLIGRSSTSADTVFLLGA